MNKLVIEMKCYGDDKIPRNQTYLDVGAVVRNPRTARAIPLFDINRELDRLFNSVNTRGRSLTNPAVKKKSCYFLNLYALNILW